MGAIRTKEGIHESGSLSVLEFPTDSRCHREDPKGNYEEYDEGHHCPSRMGLERSVEPSQLGNPTCQEEANDRTATIKIDPVFAVADVVLTAIAVRILVGLHPR